jgi:hypothetical protein
MYYAFRWKLWVLSFVLVPFYEADPRLEARRVTRHFALLLIILGRVIASCRSFCLAFRGGRAASRPGA